MWPLARWGGHFFGVQKLNSLNEEQKLPGLCFPPKVLPLRVSSESR